MLIFDGPVCQLKMTSDVKIWIYETTLVVPWVGYYKEQPRLCGVRPETIYIFLLFELESL